MTWEITHETLALPVALPPRESRIGSVDVSWFETEPGTAFITCEGGTVDDRWLARQVVRDGLAACGIRQAQYSFDSSALRVVPVQHDPYDDEEQWRDRQTFIYTPHNETLWVGAPGTHHGTIMAHPEFDSPPTKRVTFDDGSYRETYDGPSPVEGWVEGSMPGWNSGPNMSSWGGKTLPPHVVEALRPHVAEHLRNFIPRPEFDPSSVEGLWDDDDEHVSSVKTSGWPDIMAKAKRLIQSGNVTLLRNGYNNIVAHVIGDHGEYTSEISRDDPNGRAITQWTCECPWDQYAFQRTRQWKKYEGRPCAHVLAAYWKSLSTPLDEDTAPGNGIGPDGGPPAGMPPGPTPRSFSPVMTQPPGVNAPQPGVMDPQQGPGQAYMPMLPEGPQGAPIAPSPTPMVPAALTPPLMAPPAENGILPPFPLDQEQYQQPVSVPGGRPGPYPANPVQQPGTFSHIKDAIPRAWGDMYHVTPRKNRESILQHGLGGHDGEGQGSPWAGKGQAQQPKGNYVFDNLDDAHDYVYGLHTHALGHELSDDENISWEDRMEQEEPPDDFHEWSDDDQDDWYDNAEYKERTDDPKGYDIWKVKAHGLPMAPDPETRLFNGPLDLGDIHDRYQEQAEGWQGPVTPHQVHEDVGSYYGTEPRRYYLPSPVPPERLELAKHLPSWSLTEQNYYDNLDEGNSSEREFASPWAQVPFTSWPMPGHESKVATNTQVHDTEWQAPAYENVDPSSIESLAMIYTPHDDTLHLGRHDDVHHQDIMDNMDRQYGDWVPHHKGYLSLGQHFGPQGYQWYDPLPEHLAQPVHEAIEQHVGHPMVDLDTQQQPEVDWDDHTLAHTYVAGAGDQFTQGMKARINEATLGQSEGREGATDAGQWMEVPKNAMVEVRDQDQATGWVEIIYPLKGGPMTSYHVRCFVEPEKLTPMAGPSPFQNPRRSQADHQAVVNQNAGQDLQGLPGPVTVPGYGKVQFHGHGGIQQVAQDYMNTYGIGEPHPTDYRRVNPQVAARIAQEYDRMPHAPQDPEVQASYQALAKETLDQYHHAVRHGYNFEYYPNYDPYPDSPREAVLDLHHNKHMYVYPTHDGYGSSDDVPQDHPLLAQSPVQWNGQPTTYNDLFRAVHDFYGHAKEGLGFRADGEDNAWHQHNVMFSPLARRAMTAETRGQNSWVNFGPHGDHNRTATSDTVYADQKAGIMPEWTQDPNLHQDQPEPVTAAREEDDLPEVNHTHRGKHKNPNMQPAPQWEDDDDKH